MLISVRRVLVRAVRQDIDARVIAHIMDILAYGLVGMDDFLAKDKIPAIEDIIEGIAAVMDKAFSCEKFNVYLSRSQPGNPA